MCTEAYYGPQVSTIVMQERTCIVKGNVLKLILNNETNLLNESSTNTIIIRVVRLPYS